MSRRYFTAEYYYYRGFYFSHADSMLFAADGAGK